jgi:hypothetical protein
MSRAEPGSGPSPAFAFAEQFEFVERMKRSQRLPPRGQFRVVAADVHGPLSRRFPHTLFFSSLLAAPMYQELVGAHYTLPAEGKHGPFNVGDLTPADYTPIPAAELQRRVAQHLDYRRYGCAPIPIDRRRNVTDFVDVLATQAFEIFALAPCDWFSDVANSRYPHEWSHSLLEFREYVLFDTLHRKCLCLMFAFD